MIMRLVEFKFNFCWVEDLGGNISTTPKPDFIWTCERHLLISRFYHRFYRDHYITNPNNALLEGTFIKIAHTFALFDPPKWIISWPLLYSYKNLELKMTACHMGHSTKSFTNRPSTASSTESCKMESCWPTSLTQPFFWGGESAGEPRSKNPGSLTFHEIQICLMTGSLCHGLWNNLWGRIPSTTVYTLTQPGSFIIHCSRWFQIHSIWSAIPWLESHHSPPW